MMKKVIGSAKPTEAGVCSRLDLGEEAELKMTLVMKIGKKTVPPTDVLIPPKSSARDIVNIWWATVDRRGLRNPDIMFLPRDHTEYEISNGKHEMILGLSAGMTLYVSPKAKTNPDLIPVVITWNGFGESGQQMTLSHEKARVAIDE
jgi:hypothetical protein